MSDEKQKAENYLKKSRKRNLSQKTISGILATCAVVVILVIFAVIFG